MKIGKFQEEWKGVIATYTADKVIFVFAFDIQMLNNLSKDGAIQLKTNYSHFYFPFDALADQVGTLVECSRRVFAH